MMSEALDRILPLVSDFRDGVERCRSATDFNAADYQDAYNRLSRLRDRYLFEEAKLDASEREALGKVFKDDRFIEGLMDVRQIGEHVQKRQPPPRVPLFTGARIPLDVETSARAVFADRVFWIEEAAGISHRFDHLSNLEEAEKRILKAIMRAKASSENSPPLGGK